MVYGPKMTITCIYIADFVGLILWSTFQTVLDPAKHNSGIEKPYASE